LPITTTLVWLLFTSVSAASMPVHSRIGLGCASAWRPTSSRLSLYNALAVCATGAGRSLEHLGGALGFQDCANASVARCATGLLGGKMSSSLSPDRPAQRQWPQ
jgi:hypothetical protein